MKTLAGFWKKRSNYEKVVLGLFSAFIMFCLGYFSAGLYHGSKCDICRQALTKEEHYILDVRTGEVQPISKYVDTESSIFWFSGVSHMPQEASITSRLSYMRFPKQVPTTAKYCARHTADLDSDFLVLSPMESATVCYAVQDGQTLDPDGRMITKRVNEELNCWELEISWDIITPVSPS